MIYDGTFENDRFDGHGVRTIDCSGDGDYRYTGFYLNGMRDGYGWVSCCAVPWRAVLCRAVPCGALLGCFLHVSFRGWVSNGAHWLSPWFACVCAAVCVVLGGGGVPNSTIVCFWLAAYLCAWVGALVGGAVECCMAISPCARTRIPERSTTITTTCTPVSAVAVARATTAPAIVAGTPADEKQW